MTLFRILSPAIPPQVSRSCGVGAVNDFIKLSMISRGELIINLRANSFGANDELDAFQDNRLENYHPLGVPFSSLYAIKLRCKG